MATVAVALHHLDTVCLDISMLTTAVGAAGAGSFTVMDTVAISLYATH